MLHLNDDKQEAIKQVISRINDKLPAKQRALASAFTEKFYESTAPGDILERSTLNLYGAALAQWHIAYKRLKSKYVLNVYNPKMDEHGWQSTHTIIELVVDDMPFLVDSISMALNQAGLTIHLVIHPVMHVIRDAEGVLKSVANTPAKNKTSTAEAILHFEVDRRASEADLKQLEVCVKHVLDDVRVAVEDWEKMRAALANTIQNIKDTPPPLEQNEIDQDLEFLEWLSRNHFTFLGYREYHFSAHENGKEDVLRIVPDTGLGILRTHLGETTSKSFAHLPAEIKKRARKANLLIITKSNSRSTVHRPGHLDYIGIKRFNTAGEVVGEWRFLGLYTSAAYTSRIKDIPLLRQKEQRIMEGTGYRTNGHSAKALVNIIETLPRDELFQCSADELYNIASEILHLQERQRVRLLVRQDPYGRFLSCLVFLPRERFNTENRIKVQNILQSSFNASSIDFSVSLTESVLARLYLIAHIEPGALVEYDASEMEKKITNAIRSWEDDLLNSLLQELGEAHGTRLFARYAKAFPASYRDDYPAPAAVSDILKMEKLAENRPIAMSLYFPLEATEGEVRFKIFRRNKPIYLSIILPMLENMGVTVIDERPHEVKAGNEDIIWVHDVGMIYDQDKIINLDHFRDFFQSAFFQIWAGNVENDGFNRLVLGAQLPWRSVLILRACYKYLRQTGFPFSQKYIEQALCKHPQISSLLVDLFHTRFNPDEQEHAIVRTERLIDAIEQSLDQVPSLDEDKIIRRFFMLIQAMLRTNYYQRETTEGEYKDYLSFKLDPSQIPDLEKPVPLFEIFVYSVHTEGVHLRGGKVARGGLRWSDRMEDFRTEIFGLMKTQMVKNSVIVPVGAKGGFVLKKPPSDGNTETLKKAVAHSYRTFIRGLLDITDNLQDGKVIPRHHVVRYDDDDPYLVVAADKGTASFSDAANGIAKEYGFWLGDAFASGGSEGYDHKKMGITARGAWESVKHHFREQATDIQKTDFTVIGIGSMNGDVFGNGMLLSEHIKLIGTFSHKHIFLDPDPDATQSFQERKRLFNCSRSAWTDYKKELISEGGGVYLRDAKSIIISPQVQQALDINAKILTPNELIQALLKAPVDLIWNGGIGTFIKAKEEEHVNASDRSNDNIRINASELRCKVFGEGGNLGLTANARIEFARQGGYINTDFIDNSGGVDCSDHEVNIKILLNDVVKNGDLSEVQRNQLLVKMTDEVAGLVLNHSYQQAQALSSDYANASALLDEHARFISYLEKSERLERSTWNLPDDEAINKLRAAGKGLTRPELAVLLSYAKIDLYDALLSSDIYSDPYLANEIKCYFPKPIQEQYSALLPQHRLHREIIATFNANSMINNEGITFLFRIMENTGAKAADVTRAYVSAINVFEIHPIYSQINSLDNKISTHDKSELLEITRKLVRRTTEWFLRNCKQPLEISLTIESFQSSVFEISKHFFDMLDQEEGDQLDKNKQRYIDAGASQNLAATIASLLPLYSALDITEVSATVERPVLTVAKLYFELGTRLDINWLHDLITELPATSRWLRLARAALRNDLFRVHRTIIREALLLSDQNSDAQNMLETWQEANQINLHRYKGHLESFKSSDVTDLALLTVAINEVRKLIHTIGIPCEH